MKKIICFVFLACFFIFQSCTPANPLLDSVNTNESNDATDIIINNGGPYSADVAVEGIKAENGYIEEYYVGEPITINWDKSLSEFISSKELSNEFAILSDSSDNIEVKPIYGAYLENTRIFICLFYKADELIGTKNVYVDFDTANVPSIHEFSNKLEVHDGPFADNFCYSAVKNCFDKNKNFNLIGIVFSNIGFAERYPIGTLGHEPEIYYFDGYANMSFRLIDSFTSVDDGRKAFEEYWKKKADIIATLPVFEWTTVNAYQGYINKYKNQDVYLLGYGSDYIDLLFYYDACIVIPLLDSNGEEGKYILHQLYYHNELLAEIILSTNEMGNHYPVKEIIAERDPSTGKFYPLSCNDYADKTNELLNRTSEMEIVKGIGFDGNYYTVIKK